MIIVLSIMSPVLLKEQQALNLEGNDYHYCVSKRFQIISLLVFERIDVSPNCSSPFHRVAKKMCFPGFRQKRVKVRNIH